MVVAALAASRVVASLAVAASATASDREMHIKQPVPLRPMHGMPH
ncbi:hypothetical protein [robinz microvirus RP_175]|nr:hypothetical protein [robinz microvirus RP_175]